MSRFGAISPDGKLLATTDDFRNGTITLCNLESEEVRHWKGHASHVGAITFSPSGNRLITGGADKSIEFWDVATNEEVGAMRTEKQVQRLMFLPDQQTLVSAGLAGYVRLDATK